MEITIGNGYSFSGSAILAGKKKFSLYIIAEGIKQHYIHPARVNCVRHILFGRC
jgi:hypothetical protein